MVLHDRHAAQRQQGIAHQLPAAFQVAAGGADEDFRARWHEGKSENDCAQRIVRKASRLCRTLLAVMDLVDENAPWFPELFMVARAVLGKTSVKLQMFMRHLGEL